MKAEVFSNLKTTEKICYSYAHVCGCVHLWAQIPVETRRLCHTPRAEVTGYCVPPDTDDGYQAVSCAKRVNSLNS